KRRREEDDDQEGPSAGSDRGSKRQREGGKHALASTPSEPATTSAGMSTTWTQSRQMSAVSAEDQPIIQPSQHPEWFSQPRKPPTPDHDWNKSLPAAQGNAQSWRSALAKQTDAHSSFNELLDTPIDFSNFIMNRLGLDWDNPEGQQYLHNLLQPLPLIPDNRGRHVISFAHFINNDLEYLQRAAFGRSSTGSQKLPEEAQLTKPDTYRSDLKRREAYTAYSNPRGFIYQNKDKKNRLMRIDELYKFSDGTLNDVRNALDDRLNGIKMQYLPTTI
nr:hypothetical protein [Tanacetum cinerariifolium]